MYSKDEASQLKQSFWTAFGQYIAPQPSADGLKINWVNYKTGVKHLQFKMQVDRQSAFIAIEMSHPDLAIQGLMFDQFKAFRKIMEGILGETWEWQQNVPDEHQKPVSRIVKTLPEVSIFRKEDWPSLISFFKPRIIGLDEFWTDARYSFDLFK